ncbi:MAG: hypothetical protein ACFCUG_05720 [Thiotrichales bacterium]
MKKIVLAALVPPVAVCRFGCANACAFPIAAFWVGGIALLGYHFTQAPHLNSLLDTGSLVAGITLLAIAMAWAQLVIAQVRRDGCVDHERDPICRVIPSADEENPLDEAKRARELSRQ